MVKDHSESMMTKLDLKILPCAHWGLEKETNSYQHNHNLNILITFPSFFDPLIGSQIKIDFFCDILDLVKYLETLKKSLQAT